jgi:acyl-CoA synthetase (AMP-forming)/AMP-acid ligase II
VNATSFVDGRLRTGDLGSIGGDGRLRLLGRIKELIIRGGENVSPAEVESVLAAHPAVREVACFGLDDAKYGQRVAAAVVVAGASTERDLVDHCRLQLADFKVPSSVYIVETIPRTATGKLQRNRLPDLLGLAVALS